MNKKTVLKNFNTVFLFFDELQHVRVYNVKVWKK